MHFFSFVDDVYFENGSEGNRENLKLPSKAKVAQVSEKILMTWSQFGKPNDGFNRLHGGPGNDSVSDIAETFGMVVVPSSLVLSCKKQIAFSDQLVLSKTCIAPRTVNGRLFHTTPRFVVTVCFLGG